MDPLIVTQTLSPEDAQEYFLRVAGGHVLSIISDLRLPNQDELFKHTTGGFRCTTTHTVILSYLTQPCIPKSVKSKLNTFEQYSSCLGHSRDGPTTVDATKYFTALMCEIAKAYRPRKRDIGDPMGFDRNIADYLKLNF